LVLRISSFLDRIFDYRSILYAFSFVLFHGLRFLTHGCCKATSASLCGYLNEGQLNNGNDHACRQLCTHSLPANRSGLSEPEIDLEHAFVLLISPIKETRQMAKFARCSFAKITANCSNSFCHFHLISSMSRPQRPLITCLYAMAIVGFPFDF
jgi:hypothetical protein